MRLSPKPLPTDLNELQELVRAEQAKVSALNLKVFELTQQNESLLEQFRLSQHQKFGRSADELPGQGELFNEAEEIDAAAGNADGDKSTPSVVTTPQRKKSGRKPLPKELPRRQVIHDIEETDKVCPCCDGALHQMGEETSGDCPAKCVNPVIHINL